MNRNLKIISIFMVLVLCLSFSASAADGKVKTKEQVIKEKIQNKDFVKYQQWHDKNKFDREVAGNLNLKVQSINHKVPDGFEPAPDGYQTMVSYKNNGKIHIRDTEHKVETIQVPWNEIESLTGFDGSTVLISHYNDFGLKDGVWVQEVYNIDGYCYLEEIPFSEVVVSGFTGVYQFTLAANYTANDEPGIGYTFDSDFVNYLNASFETIYDDTDPYPQYSTDGLVAWYRFDEGTGTLVQDFSGNGNNGTAQNGMGWTDGQIEGAGDFDGTDDYVNCGNDSTLYINGDTTIEFWMSYNDISGSYDAVITKYDDDNNRLYFKLNSNNKLSVYGKTGGNVIFTDNEMYTTSTLDKSIMNHVALVLSGSNAYWYINGELDNSGTMDNVPSNIAGYLYLGGYVPTSLNLDGVIDNALVYNRALSPTEISTNYQIGYNEFFSKDDPYDIPTRGLVGWWRFDEGSGTNVSDSSGNGNHGTFAAANYTTGKYNDGGDFDGVDDAVSVPFVESLNFTHNDEITISSYVKLNELNEIQRIVEQESEIVLRIGSDNKAEMILNSFTTNDRVKTNTILDSDEYYSIIATYDGTDISIYLNGELDNSVTPTGTYGNSTSDFKIGGLSNDEYLNGTIDEVLIYSRGLSEEEIEQLYYIKTSQLRTRTNSNSTYSGFWNDSTDNPISIPFGTGESISSLRFDNTSSIEQEGITIYEPGNMLFNISVEAGHTENTTNIYEEINGDSYQVFIQHIPGVDSVSGTVEFTSDANAILSSPFLITGMDTNNTNASMEFNVATREWTVTTGPVVANQTYNYVLYGVLEGSTLENIVEGGFGNDNMEAYTAAGNDTVIIGSAFTATTPVDEIWGNAANDLAGDTGGLVVLGGLVGVIAIILVTLRRNTE